MSAPHEDDMAPQPPDGDAERSAHSADDHWDSGWSEDGFDEVGDALRERFRQAVSGLEPGPGTLDYLRRAVPARRRRRHAALAATAVSVFAVSAGATLAARGSFDSGPTEAGGTNIGNLMTTATDDAPGGGSGHGPSTADGRDMTSGGVAGSVAQSSSAAASGSTKTSQTSAATSASVTGSPSVPLCQNSSVASVTATPNGTSGGVTYVTFDGMARTACVLRGLPGLSVTAAGGVPAKVTVSAADQSVAPLLPSIPSGQTLVLQPGDRFEFQLAWAPATCPTNPPPTVPPTSASSSSGGPTQTATSSAPTPTGASPSPSSQPTPSGTPSSSAAGSSAYSVAYSVSGSQPVQSVSFRAECGAALYVTNYFTAPGQRHADQPTTAASSSR